MLDVNMQKLWSSGQKSRSLSANLILSFLILYFCSCDTDLALEVKERLGEYVVFHKHILFLWKNCLRCWTQKYVILSQNHYQTWILDYEGIIELLLNSNSWSTSYQSKVSSVFKRVKHRINGNKNSVNALSLYCSDFNIKVNL